MLITQSGKLLQQIQINLTNITMEAKFKKGDKVKYLPKMSGLNPNKKLTIKSGYFKEVDELSEMFRIKFEPCWVYSFKEFPNLEAIETDLILTSFY
jgi:hypothetical protein